MYSNQQDGDLLSDEDRPTYLEILAEKLQKSQKLILNKQRYSPQQNKDVLQRIRINKTMREQKLYTHFMGDMTQGFQIQWNNYVKLFPIFKNQVKSFAQKRVNNVFQDLINQKLQIGERLIPHLYSYEDDTKNGQLNTLRGQSQEIKKKLLQINSNLDQAMQEKEATDGKNIYADLYTQQKRKQYQTYIAKKKKQKQQRKKKIQQQQKKQEQQERKRLEGIKQNQLKQLKQRKQQFLKKQMQKNQIRKKQRQQREHRNSEYIRIKKQLKQKPPLYAKIMNNYQSRKDYKEMQIRHQVLSQKKQRYKHIDEMRIQQHQQAYEQFKKRRQEQRLKKMEQYAQELQKQKSRVRYHHSVQLEKQTDKQRQERQLAKEKQNKMRQYQQIVKQNFKPRVNEQKKKQMMNLIEELELNSKRLKKTKLQDGKIIYEQMKQLDPRVIGMAYLQKTKQMAAKARMNRSASANDQPNQSVQKKKPRDYLAQWRNNPRPKASRFSVVKSSNLSYDDKLNKVLNQTQKINQLTKQHQMKLKYGKFKTSDQILTCKEQIDQNYLDIAHMKLRMIKQGD